MADLLSLAPQIDHRFQRISNIKPRPEQLPTAAVDERLNNRPGALPAPATRVVVQHPSLSDSSHPACYFNANYVRGWDGHTIDYIAAMPPTGATLLTFWMMVWERNTLSLVLLTQLSEHEQTQSIAYWPTKPGAAMKLAYGLEVYCVSVDEPKHGCSVSRLEISKDGETRVLRHYHYINWPQDGMVPMKSGAAHPEPLQHLWRTLHRSQIRRETGGVAHPATQAAMRIRASSTRRGHDKAGPRTRQSSQSVRQSVSQDDLDLSALNLEVARTKNVYSTVNKLAQSLSLVDTLTDPSHVDQAAVNQRSPDPTGSFARLTFKNPEEALYGVPTNAPTRRLEPVGDTDAPMLPVKVIQRTQTYVQPFFSDRPVETGHTSPPAVMAVEPEEGYRVLTDADRQPRLSAPALPSRTDAAKALAQDMYSQPTPIGDDESAYAIAETFNEMTAQPDDIYEEPTACQPTTPDRDESLVVAPQRQLLARHPAVVMCSDGVSRTGVMIALDYCTRQLDQGQPCDPIQVIESIRTDRPGAVAHIAQYAFLYKACVLHCTQSSTPTLVTDEAIRPLATESDFGDLDSTLPKPKTAEGPIENQPWFHGDLTRDQASAMLTAFARSQPQGTAGSYLVRESAGEFVLSMTCDHKGEEIRHLRLKSHAYGIRIGDKFHFDSLSNLLNAGLAGNVKLKTRLSYAVPSKEHSAKRMLTETTALSAADILELSKPVMQESSTNASNISLRKTGWLMKQGGGAATAKKGTTMFRRGWRKRWFVLQDTILKYFNKPGSIAANGYINLCHESRLLVHNEHAFSIETPKRLFSLFCADAQDCQQWLALLSAALESSKANVLSRERLATVTRRLSRPRVSDGDIGWSDVDDSDDEAQTRTSKPQTQPILRTMERQRSGSFGARHARKKPVVAVARASTMRSNRATKSDA
eukprot:m.92436 g.92436  ORF g.92436 m.92436 type:complete len:924 (+) comp14944_c1_seq2:126-2897(+)